ncbi:MAG: HAD-IA family hydrolase [Dehalococcoidia bacterium]|nr:HAD-IA family hydrolase [Dehalococcoidia bacterium]
MSTRGILRTVLFDIDGTLLDTREFILAAMEHALRGHGLPVLAREELARQVGRPLEAIYSDFGARPDAAPALVEAHRTFQAENLHLAAAFPGASETLGRLVRAGLKLGAVTSRSRRTSIRTMELAGLAPFFDVIVSPEDAAGLKPDPAPLLFALGRLGESHEYAAMVGDTRHDIEAGKALRMLTVGATYGFAGEAIRESGPDVVIGDIRDLAGVILDLRSSPAGERDGQ